MDDSKQKKEVKKPLRVFQPNSKKIFYSNFLKVIIVAAVIVGVLVLANSIIDFSILLYPFEVFDIDVDLSNMPLIFISIIVGVASLLAILNYFSIKGLQYEFYDDRIKSYRSAFFILLNSKEILYKNIFRVNFNKDGIFNNIFNTGTIVLELEGMIEKEEKLEFIDDPEHVTTYIKNQVMMDRHIKQAEFNAKYKMDKTAEKLKEKLEP